MNDNSFLPKYISLVAAACFVFSALVVISSASPASAKDGSRMCYAKKSPYGLGWVYERDADDDCGARDGKGWKWASLPTLFRDGRWQDMSKCENFSHYYVGTWEDVCSYLIKSGTDEAPAFIPCGIPGVGEIQPGCGMVTIGNIYVSYELSGIVNDLGKFPAQDDVG